MVRTHTLQGTFGDPYYGGNANFVGWDLIGYPGIRSNVTSRINARREAARRRTSRRTTPRCSRKRLNTVLNPAKGGHHGEGPTGGIRRRRPDSKTPTSS
jgi:hypothetical protein